MTAAAISRVALVTDEVEERPSNTQTDKQNDIASPSRDVRALWRGLNKKHYNMLHRKQ